MLFDKYKELKTLVPQVFEGRRYRLIKNIFIKLELDEALILESINTALVFAKEITCDVESIVACLFINAKLNEEYITMLDNEYSSIGKILNGLFKIKSKISSLNAEGMDELHLENYRNLIVSLSDDTRIVPILIAHSAAIMRQIKNNGESADKLNIASNLRAHAYNAEHIYASLAHKLGLYLIKSELEDLSLKCLNHDAYYHIKEKLNATKKTRDLYIENFITPIKERLELEGFNIYIKGRTKSIHSIWQKMQKQNCPFEGVYDLFAIRIIIDAPLNEEKSQCWQVYSHITDMYKPNPKRMRDWLSVPKSNGYESLHITVLGPEDKWVEVQIRTTRMDDIAEHGMAAHWRYKGITGNNIELNAEKGENKEIYVFTPKGDLYKLSAHSTVLDFAFHIHSRIGEHCTGGIVNGKNVSMRYELKSGDHVSIQTSTAQQPKQAWLDIVRSTRAKSKIRQAIRDIEAKESGLAKEILERKFRNRKIEIDSSILNKIIVKMRYKDSHSFYKDIVNQEIDTNDIIEMHEQMRNPSNNHEEKEHEEIIEQTPNYQTDYSALIIDPNIKGLDYSMAGCCNPQYGDEIFGFITVSRGIKIHKLGCPNAGTLREKYGYRFIKARWKKKI